MFINVPSQQPDGQLQQQRNIETWIPKDNKQGTYESYTCNTKTEIKLLISIPYNIKLTIKTDRGW